MLSKTKAEMRSRASRAAMLLQLALKRDDDEQLSRLSGGPLAFIPGWGAVESAVTSESVAEYRAEDLKADRTVIRSIVMQARALREAIAHSLRIRAERALGQDEPDVALAAEFLAVAHNRIDVFISQAISVLETDIRLETADSRGVKWFWYAGPRDPGNRDWCSHFVDTKVTKEILDKFSDSFGRGRQPRPASIWRGGYNCRHRLVPLVGDRAKKFEVGPR